MSLTKCIYGDDINGINDGDGKYWNFPIPICMFRLAISIAIVLLLYNKINDTASPILTIFRPYQGDLPRARQQYELSARYYGNRKGSGSGVIVSNSSRQMTNLPHIGNNMATQTSDQRPNVEGYTSDGGCLRRGDAGKKVKPTLSVRYTENPG